jgi:sialate O-acetylesterase
MKLQKRFTSTLLLIVTALSINAQPKLASLFTDNMVLQQQTEVAIWGWSNAGNKIRVTTSWNKKNYTITTNEEGKWKLKITTPLASGPYEVTITDGKPITLHNVLIGEVWLLGGQSNMEMPMKGFKGQPVLGSNDAILHAKNKQIRLYTVPRSSVIDVQQNSKPSEWKEATPESVSNFSATGFYFGRLLQDMLDVPVGLINCSYSGSFAEAWMTPEALKEFGVKIPVEGDTIKAVSRTPTTLYNGMLHPIIGFGIKGALWYQGESNYDDPDKYEKLFPALVREWRSTWGIGNFPFYYAQIAPYNYAQLPPYNSGGKYNSAFLRDAQRKLEKVIPNTAMAVLMDIGEEKMIHPANKEVGGKRLALLALAKTYGLKGFGFGSPFYDSLFVTGSIATIRFGNTANGLTSFGKELSQFEVAGANKVFFPAKAWINGSNVSLSAPEVKEPVAVRYAFKDFVIGDLFSTEGLPVSSFRTDDW